MKKFIVSCLVALLLAASVNKAHAYDRYDICITWDWVGWEAAVDIWEIADPLTHYLAIQILIANLNIFLGLYPDHTDQQLIDTIQANWEYQLANICHVT